MASWTTSYGSYVQLRVTATETNVSTANNTSRVRVQSSIYYPGGTRASNAYPQTLSVSVNGSQIGRQTGITYNLSTGSRTRTLNTYNSGNITHNADGSKSVTVRVTITDGAGDSGTINQTLTLTNIARASTLTAFSFGGALSTSTANTIRYTVGRASSTFRHQVQLRDGSTTVMSWDNQNTNGASTINLTAAQVNTLLNRMGSVTSKTFSLRVATRSSSGGGFIGSAVSRNATASVHSNVTPSASGISATIYGSGRDKTIGKFVQGFSRVTSSFTRSAGYGASISSSNIVIRRVSGSADSQTISGASGTTGRSVNLSGSYEAIGTVRDSRGRTATSKTTFTVHAYSAPSITEFTVVRNSTTPTTVNIRRYGRHSGLGGDNTLTINVQRRQGSGAWSNVVDSVTTTGDSFGAAISSTGNTVTRSYDFRLVISDQFGGRAEAIRSVSTERVVLDIHKNEGVGIGKIHEKGALDIDGDVYSNGILYTVGGLGSIEVPAGADLNDYTANGFYHNRLNRDVSTIANTPENEAFSLLVQRHAGIQQTFTSYGGSSGETWVQWIRHFYNGTWGAWNRVNRVSTGAGSDGRSRWWRFQGDVVGLQVVTGSFSADFGTELNRYINLPVSFLDTGYAVSLSSNDGTWQPIEVSTTVGCGALTRSQMRFSRYNSGTHNRVNGSFNYRYLAIGRWK